MTLSRSQTTALLMSLALGFAPAAMAQPESEDTSDDTEAVEEETEDQEETTTSDKPTGEKQKKLSDRIKSVQRKVFLKKRRVEVFPYFGLDLNDPFYQHLIIGGAVGYHLADSFAAELRGGGVFARIKQGSLRFVRKETDSLIDNPPEMKYHADLDVLWAPFYGKISLFGEGILHFDTYVAAGAGIFGTDDGLNPAANVGLGQRYFITDWLVARFELRNYLFIDSRGDESDLQNLLVVGFAVSGFFPTAFEYEFQ